MSSLSGDGGPDYEEKIAAEYGCLSIEEGRGKAAASPPPRPWPPVWGPIEDSPQYLHGGLHAYAEPWALESAPDMKDSEFEVPEVPPRMRGKVKTPVNIHATLKKFLKQVRESRGYDLEVNAPWFIGSPFFVRTPHLRDRRIRKELGVAKLINFALEQINNEAREHGKFYKYVKIQKFVEALSCWTNLITFTVKEKNVDVEKNADAMDVEKNANAMDVEKMDVDVVKTIQAMVCERIGSLYLAEWRFKPDD